MNGASVLGRGWDEALRDFTTHLATLPSTTTGRPIAPATQRTHMIYLRRVARELSVGPWEASTDDVESWVERQTLAADGPQKARLAVQLFYAWAVASGRRCVAPVELPGRGLGEGWSAAVEQYAAALAASKLSPATQAGYVKHVRWLASSVAAGPAELEVAELQAWMDQQQWSTVTRRKVLYSLGSFYKWATETGVAEWSPLVGLQTPAHARRGPDLMELSPAWRGPVDAFLRSMQASKLSEGTVAQRRWQLLKLSHVAADPWQVTEQQLELWLSNPDWNANTARAARAAVRMFYRWAVKAGHLATSPAEDLRAVRVARHLPRPTPDDVLTESRLAADDRTRMILLFAALAGLRRAEIANLHTRDLTEHAIFVQGKGGHQRSVRMHRLLWEEVTAELERRRRGACGSGFGGPFCSATGYVFPSDRSPGPMSPARVGQLASQALSGDWTLHSLRHRAATQAYAVQRDLLAVQELLGHAKPETTAIYARVPDGAMAAAVDGIKL